MTHFCSNKKMSIIILIVSLNLIFQGYQCEAKRFMDIYTTLFGYILPENKKTFKFFNGSLNLPTADKLSAQPKNPSIKSHPGITVQLILSEDVTDLKINFNISIERNGHFDTYLSSTLDSCEGLQSKIDVPFIRFFRNELMRILKPTHTRICPFKRDILYEIDNFVVTNKFLPVFYVPALKWKAVIDWWFNGQYLVTLLVMGEIEWINI